MKKLLKYYLLKTVRKTTSQNAIEWLAIFLFLGMVACFLEYVFCVLWF